MKPRQLFPVDPKGLDDVARDLLNGTPTETDNSTPPRGATAIRNPESYIILPGKTHGTYSYPDTLIAMDRVHLGKNWEQCHEALAAEDSFMPTIRQYIDFLLMLKSGNSIYDGKRNKVGTAKVNAILDDLLTKRDPYRAEWLNAKFDKTGVVRSNWTITYHMIKSDGSLEKVTEPLEDCLMADKTPGIDINHWLNNATKQGLPPKNNPNGTLYYWGPRNNTVAGFGASSVGVRLGCNGDPQGSSAGLGVRPQKIFR